MSGKAAKRSRQAAREVGIPDRLARRPRHGGLVVPFMVAEDHDPIDFKVNSLVNIRRCLIERLCAICGETIEPGEPIAFIGPADGRVCWADPWMHEECARYTASACPFVSGRRPEFRGQDGLEGIPEATATMLKRMYETSQELAIARAAEGRIDERDGRFHFEARGQSIRRERIR